MSNVIQFPGPKAAWDHDAPDTTEIKENGDHAQSEVWNETLGDTGKLLLELLDIKRKIERIILEDSCVESQEQKTR